jgi:hypothetical protein
MDASGQASDARGGSRWFQGARPLVLMLGFVGLAVFGATWAVVQFRPKAVESAAFEFMKGKIAKEAHERLYEDVRLANLGPGMQALQGLYRKRAAEYDVLLRSAADERVAEVLAWVCSCHDPPDVAKQRWRQALRGAWARGIVRLESAVENLSDFIRGRYEVHRDRLLGDLRLFTGTNALLFLAVVVMAALRARWARPLLIPTALLLVSTLVCTYFYVFQQNWFYSIIFNDYAGWSYLGYVGVVFATLLDVALNKGRVTSTIVNAVSGAVPIPC